MNPSASVFKKENTMKANSKKRGMVLIPFLVIITLFSLVLPANVSAGAGTLSIDSIVVTDELGSTGPNYTNPVTISGNVTVDNGLGKIEQYSVQIDWGDGTLEDIPNADLDFVETPPDSGVFKGAYASDLHTYDTGGDKAISVLLYHMKSTGKDGESIQGYIGTVNIVLDLASIELKEEDLNVTYDGSPKPVAFITEPDGLAGTVTYNGSETAPTDAGIYTVIAIIDDSNPEVSASGTLNIEKADATVVLSDLTQTYTGSPLTPTAITTPAGLAIDWTGAPQTDAGSYSVTATINDSNYEGSATGTFIIEKAAATTVVLSDLTQTYTGSPLTPTATTTPSGLAIDWTGAPETDAGSYSVTATINDSNYEGSATGTFVINKADAEVSVSGYTGTYDAVSHGATGTATGAGGINLNTQLNLGATFTDYPGGTANWTFDGGTNYNDQNGSADIVINKANASVQLGDLSGIYDGSPKPVSTITDPAGLAVSVTYNGSGTIPTDAGSYTVMAVITDSDYTGSASGTLVITQANVSSYYQYYSFYEISVDEPDTTEVAVVDDESDEPQPEIEVPIPESLPAPAPDPEPEYFTVDFEGNITTVPMAANGALMAQVIAGNPEGTNWLEISQGTVLQDSDGAIVNSVKISRTAVPSSDDTRVQVGAAYSCEPSGASFSEPTILTLSFDPQELPQKIASVNLSYFASNSGWVDISQSDNTQNPDGQISGAVDHFSIFAVTASKSPARFAITSMNVSRAKQQYWSPIPFVTIKGKQVSFEIDVQNEGGMDGTFDGVITIDGQQLAINELVVEAGRTGSLFFTVKDMGYGSHTINVGGVTGEFTTSRRINFPLTISTILILTLLLLTAIYLPKRWRKARR